MATRSVFIDSTFTLMQTPRLSTLNLPWGSGITISMGAVHQKANMDPTMHKNDRGGSIQRKRLRQEDLAALPSKSLGKERSVSRSRDPSQHSRVDSSGRAETFAYIPAHQRDRRIGETNSDSRRKDFYDRRREAESSHDRGQDYAKERDRNKYYGKDRERNRHGGLVRDPTSSGRDPSPDRRSHSREKVDDHKKRAGFTGQEGRPRHTGKAARLLSSSSAGSIKQLCVYSIC